MSHSGKPDSTNVTLRMSHGHPNPMVCQASKYPSDLGALNIISYSLGLLWSFSPANPASKSPAAETENSSLSQIEEDDNLFGPSNSTSYEVKRDNVTPSDNKSSGLFDIDLILFWIGPFQGYGEGRHTFHVLLDFKN